VPNDFRAAAKSTIDWASRPQKGPPLHGSEALAQCKNIGELPSPTRFPQNVENFLWNIFAFEANIDYNMPRLHGFHRFLPRLWELFFAPILATFQQPIEKL
jgi:hypothetical protein